MKRIYLGAALLLAAIPARAADYSVITLTANVARPADLVWSRIGGYCDITKWLGPNCVISQGAGDVGTIRLLNDGSVTEIMVAKTARSYTYTQPNTAILYPGTLAVEPVDAAHSRIVYTLFYDQAPLATAEAQAANRAQRSSRFQGAVDKMKELAEAP